MEKSRKGKAAAVAGYVVGNIVLGAVMTAVLMKGMPYLSGAINKAAAKRTNAKADKDDWRPVIEKKEMVEKRKDEANDDRYR